MNKTLCFVLSVLYFYLMNRRIFGQQLKIQTFSLINNEKYNELEELSRQILISSEQNQNCIAIVSDNVYIQVFKETWFRLLTTPYILIKVKESEDLLSPNYKTLESIRLVRREGCKLYIILLANGIQTSRLLRFGDRHRVLDTRANYIILYDHRLFSENLHYLWRRIVNVIFIRHYDDLNSWYELSTIAFPSKPLKILLPIRLETWKMGRMLKTKTMFPDKTITLKDHNLNVVILEHVPAVQRLRDNSSDKYTGIEIEIIKTMSKVMDFKQQIYKPLNSMQEQWGQKQLNGTFSGLLGEMVNGKADIALGNLHYTPYHLQLTDLTIPYISQCLTFLTPESQTDNSWKTLILPFKLYMWVTVLIVLLFTGVIFNCIAKIHKNLNSNNPPTVIPLSRNNANKKNQRQIKELGLSIFEELTNSILYTYGMLLVISLPKLPTGWSLRLLTGWYWLYCVLLVVSYRASMTAILANPAPRVTIDTMKQLSESSIECGGWGDQTKEFFFTSLDEIGQKIGYKFSTINNAKTAVERVSKGRLAYYENIYFLEFISAYWKNRRNPTDSSSNSTSNNTKGDRNLHIMKDCAIHMPISIGLQKNSPIKPRMDKLLRKIIEAGLIKKWLNDVMTPILASNTQDEVSVKALMNLQKLYGGFVALSIGYFISTIALIAELIHWNYVVMRDPNFDKYAIDVYYLKKTIKK